MAQDEDQTTEAMAALLPPLLTALDTLALAGRHLDPARLEMLVEAVGDGDAMLRDIAPEWPERFAGLGAQLDAARSAALRGFEELRGLDGDIGRAYRALRHLRRADEALFPLAAGISPVSKYFLPPPLRYDPAALARVMNAASREDTGLAHIANETDQRGGFSVYVPEFYTPDAAMPLVVALHGGSGHGREFLWSWIRDARGYGAILVSPTSADRTWALNGVFNGYDPDSLALSQIVERVRAAWTIDPKRILLTGMSDGGTMSYVTGLDNASPFTHLAPVAASFHPMLTQAADPARIGGLPIFLTHGARDWMFDVGVAREAAELLANAGANVTYREIEDLSHTYPREINAEILDWLNLSATE